MPGLTYIIHKIWKGSQRDILQDVLTQEDKNE
jgi:hypothetical protein